MNADALAYLAAKGLTIDEIVEFARITEKRKDPTAADRMARYRERKTGKKSVTRNVTSEPPIEYIHTPVPDISSDDESQSQSDGCSAVVESWNSMAKATGLSICAKLAGKRRKSCQARLRDDGLGAIQRAIEHIPKSSFLLGQTGSWGGANIDFLLKPDSVTKILEGKYDDRTKADRPNHADRDGRSTLARVLDDALDQCGRLATQDQVSGDFPALGNPF